MKTLFVTLSAVPLSMTRPYMKHFKRRYPEIFDKRKTKKIRDRIYIPLKSGGDGEEIPHIPAPKPIEDFIRSKGFEIESYALGKYLDGKRLKSISNLLKEEPELLKLFVNDKRRSAVKRVAAGAQVVISRHPYDIIGMSFDRGWSSCMNLDDGIYKHMVVEDVKHGSLVCYLIKTDDKNINSPISRILLKRFYEIGSNEDEDEDAFILVPDGNYGEAPAAFRETVLKFAEEYNKKAPVGMYAIHSALYKDGIEFAYWDGSSLSINGGEENINDLAMTTNNEKILDYLASAGNVNIIYNGSAKEKHYKNLLEYMEDNDLADNSFYEDFVSNCDYYEVFVDTKIPIDVMVDNFSGKIEDQILAEEWLRWGGSVSQVSPKILPDIMNELYRWEIDDLEVYQNTIFDDMPFMEDGKIDVSNVLPLVIKFDRFKDASRFGNSFVVKVIEWLINSIEEDEDHPEIENEYDDLFDYTNRKYLEEEALKRIQDVLENSFIYKEEIIEQIAESLKDYCREFDFSSREFNKAFAKYSPYHKGLSIGLSNFIDNMPTDEEDKKLYLKSLGKRSLKTMVLPIRTKDGLEKVFLYWINEKSKNKNAKIELATSETFTNRASIEDFLKNRIDVEELTKDENLKILTPAGKGLLKFLMPSTFENI